MFVSTNRRDYRLSHMRKRRRCRREFPQSLNHKLNVYILEKISTYLYDEDHLNYCVIHDIALSHTNFKCVNFFGDNLETIHRLRHRNVKWLEKCVSNILKLNGGDITKYMHYKLTNSILANVINVNDLLKLANLLNWQVADYNSLPEDFYHILWPHIDHCSFYIKCCKHQWLMDHADNFIEMHINCLLNNKMVTSSIQLMERYARYINWTSVDYSKLKLEFIQCHRNRIDALRFNETVEDPTVILEFIDIIDWTIMTASFGFLEHIYNNGPIDVPNPDEAIYIALTTNENYEQLYETWIGMTEPLKQYYTRFPNLWSNYLSRGFGN